MNKIEELNSKAIKTCGVTMFAFEDALKVIDFCENQGKKIYGIDSFIYKDQNLLLKRK
ncbi:MAG: hypothetical protein IKL10_06095 [Clostridia bacterium]|nr:hypothetical protein [Clostridia bacterium]